MKLSRVSDSATGICYSHDPPINVTGVITTGSENFLCGGLPVARFGDLVLFNCGHYGTISQSDNTCIVNGKGVAHIGCTVIGLDADITATITTGSDTVT